MWPLFTECLPVQREAFSAKRWTASAVGTTLTCCCWMLTAVLLVWLAQEGVTPPSIMRLTLESHHQVLSVWRCWDRASFGQGNRVKLGIRPLSCPVASALTVDAPHQVMRKHTASRLPLTGIRWHGPHAVTTSTGPCCVCHQCMHPHRHLCSSCAVPHAAPGLTTGWMMI